MQKNDYKTVRWANAKKGFSGGFVVQILVQIDKKKKGFSFSKSAETLTGIKLPFVPEVGTK